MVGASLEVMDRDARKMRGERPLLFTLLKENKAWPRSPSLSSGVAGSNHGSNYGSNHGPNRGAHLVRRRPRDLRAIISALHAIELYEIRRQLRVEGNLRLTDNPVHWVANRLMC